MNIIEKSKLAEMSSEQLIATATLMGWRRCSAVAAVTSAQVDAGCAYRLAVHDVHGIWRLGGMGMKSSSLTFPQLVEEPWGSLTPTQHKHLVRILEST